MSTIAGIPYLTVRRIITNFKNRKYTINSPNKKENNFFRAYKFI